VGFAHKIPPGATVRLADYDPDEHAGLEKADAIERTARLGAELGELEDLLYAAGRHAVLVVFQGRDTSGKDGAIRHLLSHVNAQSCRVAAFKVPTPQKLAHDFLWRVHKETPPLGGMTIFNRSHYEDVLVVRVRRLAPPTVWRPRYARICEFERLLTDAGTLVLKFLLHISREEQEERLLAREQDPAKFWKLSVDDWKERERWDDYTRAYEEMLSRTSTKHAPWLLVPANRKWFRDLAVTEAVVQALRPLRAGWLESLRETGERELKEIREYRAGRCGGAR